jgi:hypothetical protein
VIHRQGYVGVARPRVTSRTRRRGLATTTMIAQANALTMRANVCARPSALTTQNAPNAHKSRGFLQVVGAATKEKKNRDLERLRTLANAEETFLVAGFNYKGLTVRFILT